MGITAIQDSSINTVAVVALMQGSVGHNLILSISRTSPTTETIQCRGQYNSYTLPSPTHTVLINAYHSYH